MKRDGSRLRSSRQLKLLVFFIAATNVIRFTYARDDRRPEPIRSAGSAPIKGSIALTDQQTLQYAFHFDHNALRDCVIVQDSLIALTWSGNLLRFDPIDLRLTAQTTRPFKATSIAVDSQGRPVAGFEDGMIFALDPVTLKMRPIAAMAGKIVWIGTSPRRKEAGALVVAVADSRGEMVAWPGMTIEEHDRLFRARKRSMKGTLSVGVLPTGPTHRFSPFRIKNDFDDMAPNAFLIDGVGRLWLGVDAGEFGGLCAFLDMRTGRLTIITDRCPGVLGFAICTNGRVLAFGGTWQLDRKSGVVARIDQGKWDVLRKYRGAAPPSQPASDSNDSAMRPQFSAMPREPAGPIDALLENAYGRRNLVLSEHVLFEADLSLTRWSRGLVLPARWIPGRRYSIGKTSTVTRLLRLPNEPASVIIPTGRDGFFRVSGPSVQHSAVPDQPALTPRTAFADIWPTALGVLFLADRRGFNANDEFLWRLQGTQWEGISLRPRRPSQQRLIHRRWREVRPLLADNDGVWAHLRDNLISDAEGLWVRLIADEIEEAPYWHSVNPKDMFQTPDRTIYRTYQGSLLRWRGMQWRVTGSDKRIQRQDFLLPGAHGRKVVVLGDQTLPWIYYDVEYGRVYCIREGGDGLQLESCRFFGATSKPGPILDAAYTGGGMYGIVTVRGVFILNAITGQLHEIRSPEPASRIRSMCRDGSGRLWLVGDRLHLSSTNGQSWTSLVDLPMVGPTETKRLRANPGDPSGVILALHDRGVVFLTTH